MADDFIQDIEDLTTETERQKDIDDAIQLELDQLKIDVEELEVTKGSVARYTVDSIGISIATRDGEIVFNNADPEIVTFISFAAFDLDGHATRPVSAGDIVEFDLPDVIARYVAAGDDASSLQVTYAGGADGKTISVGDTYECFIYPQNAGSASKDYVDAADDILQGQINDVKGYLITLDSEKVSKSGDTMTGNLTLDAAKVVFDNPGGESTIDGSNTNSVRILTNTGADDQFKIANGSRGTFFVMGNGVIKTGANPSDAFIATEDQHLTTKKYVDDALAANDALDGTAYLKKAGDTMKGTLTSRIAGSGYKSFLISNESDNEQAWALWCPGGVGSEAKYVGRSNTGHWFQVYDASDSNPKTTAKFGYGNFSLSASTGITYSATDFHNFNGSINVDGMLKLERTRESGPTNNFQVWGRAKNASGALTRTLILKDYLQGTSSTDEDYVAYNGGEQYSNSLVTKSYVDTKIDGASGNVGGPFLPLSGGKMEGFINMANQYITNPHDPQSANDVGDRGYNDARYWQAVTSTNNTMGINYKGQSCIDGTNSTPSASGYQTGALIWSTVSNTLFVKG